MSYTGIGVPKDDAAAATWFRKAADQGHATAQYELGHLNYSGLGVAMDWSQAIAWFQKAADQGNADAQYALGGIYERGVAAPRNSVEAHKWFSLAAANFAAPKQEMRTAAESARDRVAATMTAEQIAEAQALARDWKPK
jgi:hypothetical protein